MGYPSIVLTYFDIKGKAEATRLALVVGGIPFEDRRVDMEAFKTLKPNLPFGQVPVMEIDGKVMAQSIATLYYAGHLAGLVPDDHFLVAKVLEVLMSVEDMTQKFVVSIHEPEEDRKLKQREKLRDELCPVWLGQLEKLIVAGGKGGHCVGESLTIADILVYTAVEWLFLSGIIDGIPKDMCDKHPVILKVVHTVKNHPKVQEWEASRTK